MQRRKLADMNSINRLGSTYRLPGFELRHRIMKSVQWPLTNMTRLTGIRNEGCFPKCLGVICNIQTNFVRVCVGGGWRGVPQG